MKYPVFVSAFGIIYVYGTYFIYKEVAVRNKYMALKYFGR